MTGTAYWYTHTDQWRYDRLTAGALTWPGARGRLADRTVADCLSQAVTLRVAVGALVTTVIIGAPAARTGQPLLFPSLGPTAYLLFATPTHLAASPRNAVLGHLIGIASGAAGLAAFHLWHAPVTLEHLTWARVGASALALTFTCGGMAWARVPHPPAGATTPIIALGVLHTPFQLVEILIGVVLLIAAAVVGNRLTGVPHPWWRPSRAAADVHEDSRTSPHT